MILPGLDVVKAAIKKQFSVDAIKEIENAFSIFFPGRFYFQQFKFSNSEHLLFRKFKKKRNGLTR